MTVHTGPAIVSDAYGRLDMPKLVAIFGTGRNGSTLLTRLLDGLAGTYVHPVESNFLSAINDLYVHPYVSEEVIKNVVTHPLRHLDRPVPVDRLRCYYAYHQKEIETDLLAVVDGVELGPPPFDALANRPSWLASDFVIAFLRAFAGWLQPSVEPATVIFKTIETPYIADYERLFPAMRFIHIIRDPVEMWASQKRSLVVGKNRPPWYLGMDNLSACMDRRWIPHARSIVERMNESSHFVLRYENLVREPKVVMSRLLGWMGRKDAMSSMAQTVLGGRHPSKLLRYSSQPGVETSREVVADLKTRFGYVDVISQRERDLIRLATWSLGRRLGYGLDDERPDPEAVRMQWRKVDAGEFRLREGIRSSVLDTLSFLKRRQYVRRVCRESGQ